MWFIIHFNFFSLYFCFSFTVVSLCFFFTSFPNSNGVVVVTCIHFSICWFWICNSTFYFLVITQIFNMYCNLCFLRKLSFITIAILYKTCLYFLPYFLSPSALLFSEMWVYFCYQKHKINIGIVTVITFHGQYCFLPAASGPGLRSSSYFVTVNSLRAEGIGTFLLTRPVTRYTYWGCAVQPDVSLSKGWNRRTHLPSYLSSILQFIFRQKIPCWGLCSANLD